MKRVYAEPTPIFIHQLKDLLEEKGIGIIMKNEFLSGGVGELPPTEIWPELWVINKDDEAAAKRMVHEFIQQNKEKPQNWICGQCGEKIEGQFNICWSCGSHMT